MVRRKEPKPRAAEDASLATSPGTPIGTGQPRSCRAGAARRSRIALWSTNLAFDPDAIIMCADVHILDTQPKSMRWL